MSLLDILTQAAGSQAGGLFDQVLQGQAQPGNDVLGSGLAAAFRSDQTPPIGELVGQLFGNSNGAQQAGMLNQILATLGPAAAAALGGGVLGKVLQPGTTQITPDQASMLSPDEVQVVVNHAHDSNPGIADVLGSFYAEHSTLVNTIGGAVAAVALSHMKDRLTQRS